MIRAKTILLLLVALPVLAQDPGVVYKVTFSSPGVMGIASDCSPEGYILAKWEKGNLHADGATLDANGTPGPELLLNLITDFSRTRKYDAGQGLSGVFNGCFGETYPFGSSIGYSGNLFIYVEKKGASSTIRFLWHFFYYLLSGNIIREHFTLESEKIPFPAWTGGTLSGRVFGKFDVLYYLKEGRTIVSSYQSITGGGGRTLAFDVAFEPLP